MNKRINLDDLDLGISTLKVFKPNNISPEYNTKLAEGLPESVKYYIRELINQGLTMVQNSWRF